MLHTNDFDYDLPEWAIAQFPEEKRGNSRLLVFGKEGISHRRFYEIGTQLQTGDLLVVNETKVIPARLHFKRSTGATIEVFLLSPVSPFGQTERAMQSREAQIWDCMIGNLKKWKDSEKLHLLTQSGQEIQAELVDRQNNLIRLRWTGGLTFGELLSEVGEIPLPPYIQRELSPADSQRYQTVFARKAGAVAAPTAGLHFTPELLQNLENRGVGNSFICLHVGSGTFQPVKGNDVRAHDMHSETFEVHRKALTQFIGAQRIIATGTTSLRTLESLYWMGIKIIKGHSNPFQLGQFEHETLQADVSFRESLQSLLDRMDSTGKDLVEGKTAIMITPGYRIRSIKGLITNFHLPKSTLIMLVAAWVGEDWRRIYGEALEKGYRFLSYGDSSLLFSSDR